MDQATRDYLEEKFKRLEDLSQVHDEVLEGKMTHNMAQTRVLFDDVKADIKGITDRQDTANHQVAKVSKKVEEHEPYIKIIKFTKKHWAKLAIVGIFIGFGLMGLYHKINFNKTAEKVLEQKFGVVLEDTPTDSIN